MSTAIVKETLNGISFKIKVQPRSSRNEVIGWYGDALKIKLTAPPVDGEANEACLKFLAISFKVSPRQVKVISGLKSKNKTIEIVGFTTEEFYQYLQNEVSG